MNLKDEVTQERPYSVHDLNDLISLQDCDFERGKISDGYHTFDELYEFRMLYNAALFNEWADDEGFTYPVSNPSKGILKIEGTPKKYKGKYNVHKSWRHHDGELCFGGGWFIVVAVLPTGQISNHYRAEHWDLFKIPESEKAKYEFDGHTPQDVVERLKSAL